MRRRLQAGHGVTGDPLAGPLEIDRPTVPIAELPLAVATSDILFGMQLDETMSVTTLGRTSLVVAASDGPGG